MRPDFESWSVRQLKKYLATQQVDTSRLLEKTELVAEAAEAHRRESQAVTSANNRQQHPGRGRFEGWSIKQLQEFVRRGGGEISRCVERSDLEAQAFNIQARAPPAPQPAAPMSNPYTNPYGVSPGGNSGAPNPYGAPDPYGGGAPSNPYGPPASPNPFGNPYSASPYPPSQSAPQQQYAQPGKPYAAPVVYSQGQAYGAPPAPYTGAPPPAAYGGNPQASAHGRHQASFYGGGSQQGPSYPQAAMPQYPSPSTGPGPAGASHGSKRALLIGVTYPGTQAALKGCINDAQCMHYLLKTRFGYPDTDFLMLRDDKVGQRDPRLMPTRGNIVAGMEWLLRGAKSGDRLFFHFSGHGSQERDRSGDEDDGMNETILPCDYKHAGQIVDDELNRRLVNPVPTGCRLYAVIDACHSGSALDLPYHAGESTGMRWASTYRRGYTKTYKGTAGGRALQIAACSDSQTAADTNSMSRSVHTGAATYSFIEAIERGGVHQTWAQLLHQMGAAIKRAMGGVSSASMPSSSLIGLLLGGGSLGGGHSQTPQISSNEYFDLNEPLDA